MPINSTDRICWPLQVLNRAIALDNARAISAIKSGTITLSYHDLTRLSAILRNILISKHGIGPGSRVIVAFDDSSEAWVVFALLQFSLGLLSASFTVLDTRSKTMNSSSRAHVLKLYQPSFFVKVGDVQDESPGSLPTVSLNLEMLSVESDSDPYAHVFPADLSDGAFVDWTSGSTGGLPKGCLCAHETLVNMYKQKWSSETEFMKPAEVGSVGYNLFSLWYWWQPLCHGGTSVLLRDSEIRDISLFERALHRNPISAVDCLTPSLLKVICMHLPSSAMFPQTVLVSGESLPLDLCKLYRKRFPENRLINVFSTTETGDAAITEVTDDLLAYIESTDSEISSCPIEKSLFGVRLELIPIPGEDGDRYAELVIAGVGAKEYIGDPVASAKGFNALGWTSRDRVKKLPRGLLAITGRLDDCVKVRGFKIDLKAIENASGCDESVALVKDDRIILFVKAKSEQGEEIRNTLHRKLSPSHIPQIIECVNAMPLTRTGKLDRARLLASIDRFENSGRMYPETPLGRILEAFSQVGLAPCENGMEAEERTCFWHRGGTSLMAISLCHLLGIPVGVILDSASASPLEILSIMEHVPVEKPRRKLERESGRIAIIGMAGRWPGHSKSMTAEILTKLLSSEYHPLSKAPETGNGNVKSGFFLDESLIKGFDCSFFPQLSKASVSKIDPHQRIFLEMAAECFVDAGIPILNGTLNCGVYASSGSLSHFIELLTSGESLEAIRETDPAKYLELELGCDKDYIALRTSKLLNLTGPSVTVQAACASALVAVVQAVNAIRQGQCDLAIAGGVSLVLPQSPHAASPGLIWSPEGVCRPFDAQANGTSNCNGGHCFLLKRYSAAMRDGNAIYGIIEGVGLVNDGFMGKDFTAPSVSGHCAAIEAALQDSGITPSEVNMVEAHGTATLVGDPMEYSALVAAYRKEGVRVSRLSIGSVKGNVGHANTAAGALGLAKATLSVWNKCFFKSGSFKQLNPLIKESSSVRVQDRFEPWEHTENSRRRIAGISSLGMGGTNCHVIVSEADSWSDEEVVTEDNMTTSFPSPLLISGHSLESVRELQLQFSKYFAENRMSRIRIDDILFTVNRRLFERYRRSFNSVRELLSDSEPVKVASEPPQTAVLLFPGQGGEFPNSFPIDERIIEILKFDPLKQYADSNSPVHSQLSLFSIGFTVAQAVLKSMPAGIDVVCCGHSLGEYTAAAICGILSLEDALMLVEKRAELLHILTSEGAMAAVSATLDEISEAIIRNKLSEIEIACINKDDRITISGNRKHVEDFASRSGLTTKVIPTSGAFHSKLTEPVAKALIGIASSLNFNSPKTGFRFLSTKTGSFLEFIDAAHWSQHTRNRVLMANCTKIIHSLPKAVILDVGPGNMMTKIVQKPGMSLHTLIPVSNETFSVPYVRGKLWEAGLEVKFDTVGKQVLGLPTIGWNRQVCWPSVVAKQRRNSDSSGNLFSESLGYCEKWIDVSTNSWVKRESQYPAFCVSADQWKEESGFITAIFEEGRTGIVRFRSLTETTILKDQVICENAVSAIRIIQALIRARTLDQFIQVSIIFAVEDKVEFSGLFGVVRCALNEHPDLNLVLFRTNGLMVTDAIPSLVSGEYKYSPAGLLLRIIDRIAFPRDCNYGIPVEGKFLITGGLGGIGVALVNWLIESKRARHVFVLARRQADVKDFEWTESKVSIIQADLADLESVHAAVKNCPGTSMCFHLAGEVHDGLLADVDLSVDDFMRVSAGKLSGAVSLTTALPKEVPIVLFSSTSSLLGSPGQAVYACANAALDAMAGDRVISIQWGGWSKRIKHSMAARFSLEPLADCERYIESQVGFDILDRIVGNITEKRTAVAVTDVYDWMKYAEKTQINQSLLSLLFPSQMDKFVLTPEQAIMSDHAAYLMDHTDESGQPLVPATGLLMGMINATQNNLKDVVFSAPLRLGRFYSVDVLSDTVCVSSEGRSVTHASARVVSGSFPVLSPTANLLVSGIGASAGTWQPQDVDLMYSQLAQGGFAYGRCFRLVANAFLVGEMIVASIDAPPFEIEQGIYSARSCSLDACTHIASLIDSRACSAFPSSVASVSIGNGGDLFNQLDALMKRRCRSKENSWIAVMRESPLTVGREFSEAVTVDVLAVSQSFSLLLEQLVLTPSVGSEKGLLAVSLNEENEALNVPMNHVRSHVPDGPFEYVLSGKLQVSHLPIALPDTLGPDVVRVAAKVYGLSFLDVLAATGVMPQHMFGGEFSGLVTAVGSQVTDFRVGDIVCAVCPGGFRSHIDIHKNYVARIPENLSLEAAATVPVSVCTAIFAIDRARIKPGNTVLVHNASGALGQAVICTIQKSVPNVFIIGTCSSGKVEFVKSLGVETIIDSRDFASWPMSLRNSVHASIGAMHHDLLKATIPLLASFGVIVDVGKRLQTENAALSLAPFVRGLTYTTAHLDELMRVDSAAVSQILRSAVASGVIVPHRSFDEPGEALKYLSSGSHTGKVIVSVPEVQRSGVDAVTPSFSFEEAKWDSDRVRMEIKRIFFPSPHIRVNTLSDSSNLKSYSTLFVHSSVTLTDLEKSLMLLEKVGGSLIVIPESEIVGSRPVRPEFRSLRKSVIHSFAKSIDFKTTESSWLSDAIAKQVGSAKLTDAELNSSLEQIGIDSLGRLQLWQAFKKKFPHSRLSMQFAPSTLIRSLVASSGSVPSNDRITRKKWLGIHGFRANKDVFQIQLSELLTIFPDISLHSINAPHAAKGPCPQPGDGFEWWASKSDYSYDKGWLGDEGLEMSMQHLRQYVQTQGPFDGVVGFSQGAAMAHFILSCGIVNKGLLFSPAAPRGRSWPPSPASQVSIQAIIISDPADSTTVGYGCAEIQQVSHSQGHAIPRIEGEILASIRTLIK